MYVKKRRGWFVGCTGKVRQVMMNIQRNDAVLLQIQEEVKSKYEKKERGRRI